jgi:DNA-binding HxlR family transcriptional regulator
MEKVAENACMIINGNRKICILPSEDILKLLGKKYTLLIIGLLGNEEGIGFNKVLESIGKPRANLLSHRFKEMEELNLVARRVVGGRPMSVEYSLTEKGNELRNNLIPLFDWIEKEESARD